MVWCGACLWCVTLRRGKKRGRPVYQCSGAERGETVAAEVDRGDAPIDCQQLGDEASALVLQLVALQVQLRDARVEAQGIGQTSRVRWVEVHRDAHAGLLQVEGFTAPDKELGNKRENHFSLSDVFFMGACLLCGIDGATQVGCVRGWVAVAVDCIIQMTMVFDGGVCQLFRSVKGKRRREFQKAFEVVNVRTLGRVQNC